MGALSPSPLCCSSSLLPKLCFSYPYHSPLRKQLNFLTLCVHTTTLISLCPIREHSIFHPSPPSAISSFKISHHQTCSSHQQSKAICSMCLLWNIKCNPHLASSSLTLKPFTLSSLTSSGHKAKRRNIKKHSFTHAFFIVYQSCWEPVYYSHKHMNKSSINFKEKEGQTFTRNLC